MACIDPIAEDRVAAWGRRFRGAGAAQRRAVDGESLVIRRTDFQGSHSRRAALLSGDDRHWLRWRWTTLRARGWDRRGRRRHRRLLRRASLRGRREVELPAERRESEPGKLSARRRVLDFHPDIVEGFEHVRTG